MRILRHRSVTLRAVVTVLGTQDSMANRVRVLVLEDYVPGSPIVAAAEALCLDMEVYGRQDQLLWGEIILSEPWDIILVDAPDVGLIVGGGPELVDYLNAGGRAIVSTFNPDRVPGLESALGIDSTIPYFDALPIWSWDNTHPVPGPRCTSRPSCSTRPRGSRAVERCSGDAALTPSWRRGRHR